MGKFVWFPVCLCPSSRSGRGSEPHVDDQLLAEHPHAIIVADDAACGELKVDTYRYFKDIEKDNLL